MPTLNFDTADFTISYESNTATERGYVTPGTTANALGLLNAGFAVDNFASQAITLNAEGEQSAIVIGTATLREDYIAEPFQANPNDPDELNIAITVAVDGLATPLVFESTPTVQSGPAGFTFTPPFDRSLPAPTNLPGSTGDADVDFRAEFAPVSFELGGNRYTADIADIIFTQPTGPGDSGAGTQTPVDVEDIVFTLHLDTLGSVTPPVTPPTTDSLENDLHELLGLIRHILAQHDVDLLGLLKQLLGGHDGQHQNDDGDDHASGVDQTSGDDHTNGVDQTNGDDHTNGVDQTNGDDHTNGVDQTNGDDHANGVDQTNGDDHTNGDSHDDAQIFDDALLLDQGHPADDGHSWINGQHHAELWYA